jgi:cyanophycinase-like exopeptidase
VALLVVMGSGETAPTMVRVHRQVLARSGPGPRAMLDTPFGFQNNADDLVARTRDYFAQSVGEQVQVASWRRADAPTLAREQALALLHGAGWVFAGPGSPSYALRQWQGTPVPAALLDVAAREGTLVFGSAAAVTLGSHAVPVYEIYKVGADPAWLEGLDLLGSLTGIRAAVVPHFDNNEGGSYDTRFCYLGEPRLALLERELPDDVGVLGVDEHTALLIDTTAREATVVGNGVVTVRRRGRSLTFADSAVLDLDTLAGLLRGEEGATGLAVATGAGEPAAVSDAPMATSLGEAAQDCAARFDRAWLDRDVPACVSAVLDLEDAVTAWREDTLQSDDADRARRLLRSMVVRLGEWAGSGARDPGELVGPFVQALLDVRAAARAAKDFATSDLVRDRLGALGVEVRDTADGVEWVLTPPDAGGGSSAERPPSAP